MQELYGLSLRQIGLLEFYKPYLEMIDRENPYPRGYRILNFFLFFLEKMANPPWNMLLDSLCNVGSWSTMRISIISSLDHFLIL